MTNTPATLSQVHYPVEDVARSVHFFAAVLGLPVRFVDGERFAMLGEAGTALSLAGPGEQAAGAHVAAAFKVGSVIDTIARATELGATIEVQPRQGAHEVSAVLRDPEGNFVIVYQPLSD